MAIGINEYNNMEEAVYTVLMWTNHDNELNMGRRDGAWFVLLLNISSMSLLRMSLDHKGWKRTLSIPVRFLLSSILIAKLEGCNCLCVRVSSQAL